MESFFTEIKFREYCGFLVDFVKKLVRNKKAFLKNFLQKLVLAKINSHRLNNKINRNIYSNRWSKSYSTVLLNSAFLTKMRLPKNSKSHNWHRS